MPDNVEDATSEILKSIQASIADLARGIDRSDEQNARRFAQLEASLRKDRRAMAGMLVMMRATAGDFDERVSEIEERVAALEGRAS